MPRSKVWGRFLQSKATPRCTANVQAGKATAQTCDLHLHATKALTLLTGWNRAHDSVLHWIISYVMPAQVVNTTHGLALPNVIQHWFGEGRGATLRKGIMVRKKKRTRKKRPVGKYIATTNVSQKGGGPTGKRRSIHYHRGNPPFLFFGVCSLYGYGVPFFPDLWCTPLCLVFPSKWYAP